MEKQPKEVIAELSADLRILMLRLYALNPDYLRKSSRVSAKEFVEWVFEGPFAWKFEALGQAQGDDALALAFKEDYSQDRILPLITGLQTTLLQCHDSLGRKLPQTVAPVAKDQCSQRFVLTWQTLLSARDAQGLPQFALDDLSKNDFRGIFSHISNCFNAQPKSSQISRDQAQ